jgi:hypothetical protein
VGDVIEPPLIVVDEREIHVFGPPADMARGLAPVYAREVEHEAYDSAGRRLELAVERQVVESKRLGRARSREQDVVVARALEDEPAHAAPLARALRKALAPWGGIPADVSGDVPLSRLVRMSVERFGTAG